MNNSKYLFVNTHSPPDYHYGGVVESGSRLYKYFSRLGNFSLATVSRNPAKVKELFPEVHCYQSWFFHRFAVSLDAILGLWRDVRACDALLINGIFTVPVTLAALYAAILNKPFIVAVRGGLKPWAMANKKWKKYFYIKLITFPLMRRAKYVHVTSVEEEKNIRDLGFNKVIRVSNGIDAEEYSRLPGKAAAAARFGSRFVFLFLSRTDKEKGLDILLAAYRKLCLVFPEEKHVLLLVGPDHQGYLKSMGLNFARENIERIEGVYGTDKLALVRRADTLVLPSYSENFGNVVAEALACETPVITTTGTPWSEIEEVGCGLYIKPEAEALYQAMKTMYEKSPAERAEMGRRGREYIFKNFNWEDKARQLFAYLEKAAAEK